MTYEERDSVFARLEEIARDPFREIDYCEEKGSGEVLCVWRPTEGVEVIVEHKQWPEDEANAPHRYVLTFTQDYIGDNGELIPGLGFEDDFDTYAECRNRAKAFAWALRPHAPIDDLMYVIEVVHQLELR
jgi:hypothetical protein